LYDGESTTPHLEILMDTLPVTSELKTPLNSPSVRAAEPADAQAMSELIGSPGVFEGTLQMPYAAVASRLEWFNKTDPQNLRLVAVVHDTAKGADTMIGHADLFKNHTSLRRAHARGLGITVAKEWQGQGVGDLLMTTLTSWADNWGHVLRIELTVFADNARAIALYQRHGFVKEGQMTAFALRDGVYTDAWAMARLHPKPPRW
jgi:L-phenylalanine/L-methionine N-acetyltransferase